MPDENIWHASLFLKKLTQPSSPSLCGHLNRKDDQIFFNSSSLLGVSASDIYSQGLPLVICSIFGTKVCESANISAH